MFHFRYWLQCWCLDAQNCSTHVQELLKPHLIKQKKNLHYLTDLNKDRPTKLNRAKIAELGESLSPLLDVSILSMSQHIQQLAERASACASKKKKSVGTCGGAVTKKKSKK